MDQKMPCKESGCPETVFYKREFVLGLAATEKKARSQTITVYLKCKRNHEFPYQVQREV